MTQYLQSIPAGVRPYASPRAVPNVVMHILALVLPAFAFFVPLNVCAAQDDAVDATEALQSIGSTTWYDDETDDFTKPKLSPLTDNELRTEGTIAEEANARRRKSSGNSNSWFSGRGGNWGIGGAASNLISSFVLGLLAALLVTAIVLLTYYSLRNYVPNRWERKQKTSAVKIDLAKVSDLPFEVQQATHDNPLAEAEALLRAGKFERAMVFLYGYMLLALDQARKIELQKGKTNRMYLREVRTHTALAQILEPAMFSFEDVYFGKHQLPRERFLMSWNSLDRFHQQLGATQATGGQTTVEVALS